MVKLCLLKWLLLALFACVCAANLSAQDPEMIPPPIPALLPPDPPDLDILPPPSMNWESLPPKGEDDQSNPVTAAVAPLEEAETTIVPPPPPVIEPLLDGPPDPDATDLVRPEIEVWRPESEAPQRPVRRNDLLAPAFVTGNALVTLRVQFDQAASGKNVFVRPGRGMSIASSASVLSISAAGECEFAAQLAEGINRSHIIFYCDGVRTVQPIVRAPLSSVLTNEGGE